jgi:ABC-type amino acid transport system permease subunit
VYTAIAVIYFIMLFPTTLLAQAYERRLARK